MCAGFPTAGRRRWFARFRSVAGAAKAWQYQALAERAHLALLGRKPEPEAVSHWQQVLEAEGRLEWLLAEVCQAAAPQQGQPPGKAA